MEVITNQDVTRCIKYRSVSWRHSGLSQLTSIVLREMFDDAIIVIPLFDVENKPAAVTFPTTSVSSARTPPSLEKSDPPTPFCLLKKMDMVRLDHQKVLKTTLYLVFNYLHRQRRQALQHGLRRHRLPSSAVAQRSR